MGGLRRVEFSWKIPDTSICYPRGENEIGGTPVASLLAARYIRLSTSVTQLPWSRNVARSGVVMVTGIIKETLHRRTIFLGVGRCSWIYRRRQMLFFFFFFLDRKSIFVFSILSNLWLSSRLCKKLSESIFTI